jgi:hypothetical protein
LKRGGSARAAAAGRIALLLWAAVVAREAAAQPTEGGGPTRGSSEGGLDDFVVPGLPQGLLRLEVGSGFAPSANAGGSEVSVATPGGRLRLQGPVGERVGAQAFIGYGTTLYDVQDSADLFTDCENDAGEPLNCPVPDEFYAASFGAQVAYLLNPHSFLFFEGERWALVGESFIRGRWERGAFEDSLKVGTIAAVGYDLTKHIRVAIGAQVDVNLDGAASRWSRRPLSDGTSPSGSASRTTASASGSRVRRFEFFVAGYRSSDGYRLHDRDGLPAGAGSRPALAIGGVGGSWPAGCGSRRRPAIVDRRLSVTAMRSTLSDQDVASSPYIDVRLGSGPSASSRSAAAARGGGARAPRCARPARRGACPGAAAARARSP